MPIETRFRPQSGLEFRIVGLWIDSILSARREDVEHYGMSTYQNAYIALTLDYTPTQPNAHHICFFRFAFPLRNLREYAMNVFRKDFLRLEKSSPTLVFGSEITTAA